MKMTEPIRRRYDLAAWLREAKGVQEGAHLVGREIGRQLRDRIERELEQERPDTIITLDCAGVDHLDLPGAHECFVKLVTRLQAMEYGEVYLMLSGMTPTQEENIAAALDMSLLHILTEDGKASRVIGPFHPYLAEVFATLQHVLKMTARELADADEIPINVASTKLLNLQKTRLVRRVSERLPDGGRQFVYYAIRGG